MKDKLKFKIISFFTFDNSDDVKDCLAILEDGTKIVVDPFVGCAFDYNQREHLLGVWWEAEGNWHENVKYNIPKAFLPREGTMKLLTIQDQPIAYYNL